MALPSASPPTPIATAPLSVVTWTFDYSVSVPPAGPKSPAPKKMADPVRQRLEFSTKFWLEF